MRCRSVPTSGPFFSSGRSPTFGGGGGTPGRVAELARELAETIGCTVEEIIEGIESSNAYSTLSLDATDAALAVPARTNSSVAVVLR